jgi:predicted component of type VI protein secretion system
MSTTPEGTPARRLAILAVHAGPRIGEELPIASPRVSIGSGGQNDLAIADDSISTNHAILEFEHGGWRLTDLDSTNGTFVEGVRLAPQVPTPLPYGSSVRLGGLRLHFRPVAEADPESARAGYVPPAAEKKLAERDTGFRLPLWLLVVIVLVVIAVAAGIFSWMQAGPPSPAPVPQVEQTAPGDPQPPAQVAPAGAPLATDTMLEDTAAAPLPDTAAAVGPDTAAPPPLEDNP